MPRGVPPAVVTGWALGVAWGALILAGAARRAGGRRHGRRGLPSRLPAWPAPATALGAAVRRLAGRPADPAADRRLGSVVAAGLAGVLLAPEIGALAGLAAWLVPAHRGRQARRREAGEVVRHIPEVADLLVLAVGAGLTVPLAVDAVGRRGTGPLAVALARAAEEARLGRRLADALEEIPARLGEPTRPVVAALVASERYGASLAAGLDRLAADVRADRRRRAEEAARRVPVTLLFPLVLCALPAFALLTMAPLVAGAFAALRP